MSRILIAARQLGRAGRRRLALATVAAVALAAACAAGCAASRAVTGFQGDFSEERLDDDEFWVGFIGNLDVDSAVLEQSLLRRAAEVARRNGFTHFVVTGRSRQSGAGWVLRPDRVGPTRRVQRSIIIRCYRADPGLPDAVEAGALLAPRDTSI